MSSNSNSTFFRLNETFCRAYNYQNGRIKSFFVLMYSIKSDRRILNLSLLDFVRMNCMEK